MDRDLPISFSEFLMEFGSSEEDWATYFYQAKWPSGFSCPQCAHNQAYTIQTRIRPVYQCRSCSHQTTLTAGTMLEGSRTLLSKWAFAIHTVAHSESGINAVQLQSLINVTYKTAWAMLKKIRQAISSQDQTQPLSGPIKGGLAFCGKYVPSTIQLTAQEHPVIVATTQTADQPNRIKIKLVSRSQMDGKTLTPMGCKAFTQEHVACTDDSKDITIAKFKIRPRNFSTLVNVMSQFREWANHKFHGLGSRRLQGYLDEFCFRYNHASQRLGLSNRLSNICMSFRAH